MVHSDKPNGCFDSLFESAYRNIDTQKAEGEYVRNCGEGWLEPSHSS